MYDSVLMQSFKHWKTYNVIAQENPCHKPYSESPKQQVTCLDCLDSFSLHTDSGVRLTSFPHNNPGHFCMKVAV